MFMLVAPWIDLSLDLSVDRSRVYNPSQRYPAGSTGSLADRLYDHASGEVIGVWVDLDDARL